MNCAGYLLPLKPCSIYNHNSLCCYQCVTLRYLPPPAYWVYKTMATISVRMDICELALLFHNVFKKRFNTLKLNNLLLAIPHSEKFCLMSAVELPQIQRLISINIFTKQPCLIVYSKYQFDLHRITTNTDERKHWWLQIWNSLSCEYHQLMLSLSQWDRV